MPKEGENKMSFRNYYKQVKAPYVVYADFKMGSEKNTQLRAKQKTKLYIENREA